MSTTTAEISPTTDIIRAYRAKDYTWSEMFAEFIDNSIDANAQNIELRIDRPSGGRKDWVSSITVVDDGHGCKNLEDLFQLGQHQAYEQTQIGEYGVGAKEMQMALAKRVEATTRTNGTVSMCDVDYREISSEGKWEIQIEKAKTQKASSLVDFGGSDTGMHIHLHVDKKKRLNAGLLERAVSKLEFQYRPALAQGRNITVVDDGKRYQLEAWLFPTLENREDFQVDLPQGSARVRAGELTSREDSRSGVHFVYGPRIVETSDKSLDTGGAPRTLPPLFFAYVELGEGFQLSTNKGAVKARSKIERAINEKADEMIQACREHSEEIKLKTLEAGIVEDLQEITEKEQRDTDSRDPDGDGVEPTGTGGTRDDPSKRQPGDGSAKGKGTGGEKLTGLSVEIGPRSTEELIDYEVVNDGWMLKLYVNSEHQWFIEHSMSEVKTACAAVVATLITTGDLPDRMGQVLSKAGIELGCPLPETTNHAFTRIMDE